MSKYAIEAVVAGHICADVIPAFSSKNSAHAATLADYITPGKLTKIGPALLATGGAVSNTGLALHRLGLTTSLMGKTGDDLFGHAILDLVRQQGEALAKGMIVDPTATTSYTLVISPPGIDRMFLHCPGANDTFAAADLDYATIKQARLFHFGYPTLMERMFADGGSELAEMMAEVKAFGVTTSLDMSLPDLSSPAGQADWSSILEKALPHVDVFLPSVEEITMMLDRPCYEAMLAETGGEIDIASQVDTELLDQLSARMIELGVAIAAIKLGDQGIYVRVTDDDARLQRMGRAMPEEIEQWTGRRAIAPCFSVKVAGTTGSGDCTIAGFLAGLLLGQSLEETLTAAVAVGACNCEAPDATSGIPPWNQIAERIATGWSRLPTTMKTPDWIESDQGLREPE